MKHEASRGAQFRGQLARAKDIFRLIAWLLPATPLKNALLRRLGYDIHSTAIARSNLVLKVSSIRMGPRSRIGRFNLIKDLRSLAIGDGASIGRLNVISSHPVYKRLYPDGASLLIGSHSFITSRHQLDCSGSIRVGDYSSIAGHETKILTHSIDVVTDVQVAYPVSVGTRSFVGARCLILGGARLPDNSVLAAGSVLPRERTVPGNSGSASAAADQAADSGRPAESGHSAESGLWAGVPAKYRGPVLGEWFARTTTGTSRVFVPATGETVENAL